MRMRHKRITACVVACCILLTSLSVQGIRAKAQGAKKGWSINIYMCGADLESNGMCATNDIIEIMKAEHIPDNVQIVIQTGGSKFWCYELGMRVYYKDFLGMTDETIEKIGITNISADYIQRYRVKYNNTVEQDGKMITYPSLELISGNEGINNPMVAQKEGMECLSMGDECVLEDFIRETASEYENNALIFWNHGGGTQGGVCKDEYSMDSLSLTEIEEALLKTRTVLAKEKFDMIGYDACLMSTFETLAITSRYAEYAAASMTLEPGPGWNYTPIMEKLFDGVRSGSSFTGKELAQAVVDAYNEYYLAEETRIFYEPDANMVAYDLSKMPLLVAKFDRMAMAMNRLCVDKQMKEDFLKAAYRAKEIDRMVDLVGMYSFLDETISYAENYMKRNETSDDDLTKINYENCYDYVMTAKTLKKGLFEEEFNYHSCLGDSMSEYVVEKGISFYFPQKDTIDHCAYAKWDYENLGISNNYAVFAYNIAYNIEQQQKVKPEISVLWDKKKEQYKCTLQKTDPDYLLTMSQTMFLKIDGKYYETGSFQSENKTGKMQYFSANNKYMSFNGSPLQCYLYDISEDVSIYITYFIINDEYTDVFLIKEGRTYYLDYLFEPGDTIAAVISNEAGEQYKGKSYVIKEEDVAEGMFVAPVKVKSAKYSEIRYGFQLSTMGGFIAKDTVDHAATIAFSDCKVSLSKKTFKATGEKICPKICVKIGNRTLKKGKDYKLVYENNIAAGVATVKVIGMGKYKHAPVKTIKYTIKVNYNRTVHTQEIPMAA